MTNRRKIQLSELELLKKFIAICEKHNLKYYALYGTALGAVRHKGFIPWDDDIDVGMPRVDIVKFYKLYLIQQEDGYELLHDANGISRFINNKVKIETFDSEINHPYIDVFPIDILPDNWVRRECHYTYYLFLRRLHRISQSQKYYMSLQKGMSKSEVKKIVISIMHKTKIYKLFDQHKLYVATEKHLQKYTLPTSYCGSLWGPYRKKEILSNEWFGEGIELLFEDIEVVVPQNYHAYLTHVYDDYMTPPPFDKRRDHGAVLLGGGEE